MRVTRVVKSLDLQAKRVAAYCRVSTLKENQEESFETQQRYYTDLIHHTCGWQPVTVYADEGFSGVLAEKRPGFMAMMADARSNLIDIILVKSISRFARNAKEAQRYVHELKNLGVEVRFEREGISSLDGSAEMAFSMLAVAAQEESRSISENMKWSLHKHAEQGIRHLGSNRILGYNEVHGVLVPNQDAWIVRVIFEDYAAGLYPIEIHRHLQDLGAANSTTNRIPGAGSMRKVLSNEVYAGDRMIQKGPVRDLITKQPDYSKPYTSYYLTDDHEPIVDRQLFEQVKTRLEWVDQERKAGIYRNSQSHYLYGLVYCNECGLPFRKGDGSEYKDTEYDYLVCSCRKRRDRKQRTCTNRSIRVDQLLKTLSDTLGLPWRSVEEFDSDTFVDAVERVVVKPDGIEVVMKYRQVANS
jgi:DNA invertase Pin-like site-specific DNA recombinase